MNGEKHKKNFNLNFEIKNFSQKHPTTTKQSKKQQATTMAATHTATIPESDVSNDNDDNNSTNNVVDLTDGGNSSKYLQTTIGQSVSASDVSTAEINWTLFSVTKGFSNNSATDISATFAEMFKDSAIASNFHLGKDKLKYLTNWGIAP